MTAPARDSGALTIATLRPDHIATLRAIHADPRTRLWPQQRDLLRRLGLIRPAEPPRPAVTRRTHPPARAYVLTGEGLRVALGDGAE